MKSVTQPAATPSLKWPEMNRRQKLIYLATLAVCILSFGFIFPNIND